MFAAEVNFRAYMFTACQRSCGKVMFSQVSVCPQRGREGISGPRSILGGGKYTQGIVGIQTGVGIQGGRYISGGVSIQRGGGWYTRYLPPGTDISTTAGPNFFGDGALNENYLLTRHTQQKCLSLNAASWCLVRG